MAQLSVTSTAGGDGNVYINDGGNWATVRAAASGTAQPTTDPVGVYASSFTTRSIGRIFLPFDTSALTNSAIISAVTLGFTVTTVFTNSTLHAIQTSQASPTDLVADDYNNIAFTSGGSVAVTGTGAKSITFNATGLTWINKTGVSLIGILEDHDVSNTDPGDSTDFRININMSENATPSNRPTLTITYTLPNVKGNYAYFM